jgi:hypothetical protein
MLLVTAQLYTVSIICRFFCGLANDAVVNAYTFNIIADYIIKKTSFALNVKLQDALTNSWLNANF